MHGPFVPPPLEGARKLVAIGIFPLAVVSCLGATHWALGTEIPEAAAPLVGAAIAVVFVALGERFQPHSEKWSESHDDIPTDALHVAFSQLGPPPLVDLGLGLLMTAIGVGIASEGGGMWPRDWNVWAQLCLSLVVGEFGQYWWHRLTHENGWFWRFHATHHSAPRLYWLNASRFHPMDTVMAYGATVLPLFLLGIPKEIVALQGAFTAVHGVFQHANIELRLGPLNYLFSMAELHRWHHSKDLSLANANYGANLILWDIVFGTRKLPEGRHHQPEDVGFHGDETFPQTYLGQLGTLFRMPEPGPSIERHTSE